MTIIRVFVVGGGGEGALGDFYRCLLQSFTMLLSVRPSRKADKKLDAIFLLEDGSKKVVSFGAKGYMDYTRYYKRDPELAKEKRRAYIARHRANEEHLWRHPTIPATLARYILWEKPTVEEAVEAFKRRFN